MNYARKTLYEGGDRMKYSLISQAYSLIESVGLPNLYLPPNVISTQSHSEDRNTISCLFLEWDKVCFRYRTYVTADIEMNIEKVGGRLVTKLTVFSARDGVIHRHTNNSNGRWVVVGEFKMPPEFVAFMDEHFRRENGTNSSI